MKPNSSSTDSWEENPDTEKDFIPERGVFSFLEKVLRPFQGKWFLLLLLTMGLAGERSLKPYLLKLMVDALSTAQEESVFKSIRIMVLLYFLALWVSPVLSRIYEYLVDIKITPSLRRNLVEMSFKSLLRQSYSYYLNHLSGNLSTKISDLTFSVADIVNIFFGSFLTQGLALGVGVFTLGKVNPIFALCTFFWVLPLLLYSFLFSKKMVRVSDQWSESWSLLTGKLVDSLSNILTIRLFGKNKEERRYLSQSLNTFVDKERNLQWSYIKLFYVYDFLFLGVQGISLYFLLKGYQEKWITLGDFGVVLSLNAMIVDSLWHLTKNFSSFSKAWGRISRAVKTIYVVPEIQDKKEAKALEVSEGRLMFHKVKFHYKGSKPLFEDLSVTIEPGEKVGLVGPSGSGKTTFVQLLLRLYDITEGHIFIDHQDIQEVTQNSLRKAIGIVPQDASLFHRTLMENIRYGSFKATDKEVKKAAEKAYAHSFIKELPLKYNSLAGEKGLKLSGGQRQRLSIARAILKNAPILILDEATSHLDSLTEKVIQESLEHLMKGKTTLVIAHRLSTLLKMDRILVFERGKIVEEGTHEELLLRNGIYKNLWKSQVGGFLGDNKPEEALKSFFPPEEK